MPKDGENNLELASKGISAFVKVNLALGEQGDSRLKNVVHQKMKTKRSMNEVSTSDTEEEKPKKKKSKK